MRFTSPPRNENVLRNLTVFFGSGGWFVATPVHAVPSGGRPIHSAPAMLAPSQTATDRQTQKRRQSLRPPKTRRFAVLAISIMISLLIY